MTTLDPAALRDQLATGQVPHLLDVRTPAEFAAGHVPGSENVPLDELRTRREELCRDLPEDTVLVCRSGARATQAERLLAEAGLRARVLGGGIVAWEAAGAPVNRLPGPKVWDLERQVRFVAGGLVVAGLAASLVAPPAALLSAAVGAGLMIAAVTDTCAMGMLLARMPWNRRAGACRAASGEG